MGMFDWQNQYFLLLLQEMLQNEEDARARIVKIVLDENNYGQDPHKLQHPQLVDYQVQTSVFKISSLIRSQLLIF